MQIFEELVISPQPDEVRNLQGFEIETAAGDRFGFFKYEADDDFVKSLASKVAIRDEYQGKYSDTKIKSSTWTFIQNDMNAGGDTTLNQYSYWNPAGGEDKDCYEFLRYPNVHRLLVDKNSDLIYHTVRPLWKDEYLLWANEHIKHLHSMLPDSVANTVPFSFYSGGEFVRDVYYMPLVYPYALHGVESMDECKLIRKDDESGCAFEVGATIEELSFDKRYLLLKKHDSPGLADNRYFMLDLESCNMKAFRDERELWDAVKATDFSGSLELMTLKEYRNRFIDGINH